MPEYDAEDIVRAALKQSPSDVKKAVDDIVADKVADGIDAMRPFVVADMFDTEPVTDQTDDADDYEEVDLDDDSEFDDSEFDDGDDTTETTDGEELADEEL